MEGLGLNVVPSEAWKSSDIIKVNLSKNAIEELPVEFSSCISLEVSFAIYFWFPLFVEQLNRAKEVKVASLSYKDMHLYRAIVVETRVVGLVAQNLTSLDT